MSKAALFFICLLGLFGYFVFIIFLWITTNSIFFTNAVLHNLPPTHDTFIVTWCGWINILNKIRKNSNKFSMLPFFSVYNNIYTDGETSVLLSPDCPGVGTDLWIESVAPHQQFYRLVLRSAVLRVCTG